MVSTAIAHYVYVLAHPFFSDHIQLKYAQTETVSSLDEIQIGALLAAPSEVVALVAAWRNPDSTGAAEANNFSVGDDGTVTLYQKRGASPGLTHVDAGAGAYRPEVFGFFRPDDRMPVSLEETIWPRAIAAGGIRAFPAPERPWDIGTPERLAAFERRLSEKAALTA